MKSKTLNATINTVLFLSLIVASVSTAAHNALAHVVNAGITSSELMNKLGSQSSTVVPLIVDTIIKRSDAKQAKTLKAHRTQIITAAKNLLANPEFKTTLAQLLQPVGQALASGASSAQIDTEKLVNIVATEINMVANNKVITKMDLTNISKSQNVDLANPAKVFHKITGIISILLLSWILVFLMIALLIWRKKRIAFRVLSKIFITLGLPIIIIWSVLPKIILGFIKEGDGSELTKVLFPIAYREVTNFTLILGIGYTVLAVVLYVAYRLRLLKPVELEVAAAD